MDQQTERMLRNAVRLNTAPAYALLLIFILSVLFVGGIVVVAELAHWLR